MAEGTFAVRYHPVATNDADMQETEAKFQALHTRLCATANAITESTQHIAQRVEILHEVSVAVSSEARESNLAAQTAQRETVHSQSCMTTLKAATLEINAAVSQISHIAERTNLLALNATIEAAKASESGRGFPVVANSITELAHQALRTAETVTAQVSSVQERSEEAVQAMSSIHTLE